MSFVPKTEESKPLPMTALFDVVFLLIIFFIVSTTLSGGRKDLLGIKEIDTPRESGDTPSNFVVQLFKQNQVVRCFIIGDTDNQRIEVLNRFANSGEINVNSKNSLISAFKNEDISLVNLDDLENILIKKIRRYMNSTEDKRDVSIALRTEYNIEYVEVINAIDILTSQNIKNIADINYVLLIGSIERTIDNEGNPSGLLDKIDFRPPQPPPEEVDYFTTPSKKRI